MFQFLAQNVLRYLSLVTLLTIFQRFLSREKKELKVVKENCSNMEEVKNEHFLPFKKS